jgi:hypothetical protein
VSNQHVESSIDPRACGIPEKSAAILEPISQSLYPSPRLVLLALDSAGPGDDVSKSEHGSVSLEERDGGVE